MIGRLPHWTLLLLSLLVGACSGGGEPSTTAVDLSPMPATATSDATRPPASPDQASELQLTAVQILGHSVNVPRGMTVEIFAEGLGAPRFMALGEDGVVYVADRAGGRIVRLPDEDSDGRADRVEVALGGLDRPHSLVFHDGWLYVAETDRVIRSQDADHDGVLDAPEVVAPDLPTGGHWSRTVAFGPDGAMYLSIGSSCNVCREADERRAAVLRFSADSSGEELFATGLRNAVGLAFDASGRLWATNNGRDGLGDDVPPETINLLTEGADFGWPRCHAGDIPDREFAGDRGCQGVAQPAVRMQAHSAPLGLAFAGPSTLGGAFDGDLLVAFHGSWNRTEPTGYKVVLLPFAGGEPTGQVFDFLTGFLLDSGESWARPVDILPLPDGSVLISDDAGGRMFRVSIPG